MKTNIMKFSHLLSIVLSLSIQCYAQNQESGRLISKIGWMEGTWHGQAFGGDVEEIWSSPTGNTMWGMFKIIKNGQTQLAEIEQIIEVNNSLHYRVRHFNKDFTSWEGKDEFVTFPFISVSEKQVVFKGLKISWKDENTMVHQLELKDGKSGKVEEIEIIYTRIKN